MQVLIGDVWSKNQAKKLVKNKLLRDTKAKKKNTTEIDLTRLVIHESIKIPWPHGYTKL